MQAPGKKRRLSTGHLLILVSKLWRKREQRECTSRIQIQMVFSLFLLLKLLCSSTSTYSVGLHLLERRLGQQSGRIRKSMK